jgi:hypothetical protein
MNRKEKAVIYLRVRPTNISREIQGKKSYVGFEVLTAVVMKSSIYLLGYNAA